MDRRRAWACRSIVEGLFFAAILLASATPAPADDELEYGLAERRLRRLEFVGVEFFDEERLRGLLGLRGAPWYRPFGDPTYRIDRVEQGVEQIRALYRREGFHGVRIAREWVDQNDLEGDVLRIEVDEGRRTLIDSLELSDPAPLTEDEVRALLRYREGGPAPAQTSDLGNDIYRILDSYLARGHLGATVREDVARGDSTVTLKYTIRPGPAYHVRDIHIEGNDRVDTGFIERELRLRPGQAFDASRVARTEAKLLDTGWFRDISFEPVDLDTTTAQATLRLRVVERPTGFWELGVGTGTEDRVRLSAGWGDRNVWRSGKSLTLRARVLGSIENAVDDADENDIFVDHEEELLYRHPHFLGTRFTGNANLFYRVESRPSTALELRQFGLLLNTALIERGPTSLEVELGLTRTRKEALSDSLEFDNSRAQTRSVTLVATNDTRNDVFSPSQGQIRQLLLQLAGGPLLSGDNDFHKMLASQVVLVPAWGRSVLALRAQAGWVQAWSTSERESGLRGGVPIEDRFFAGGSSSVRGYRENSLGPRLAAGDAAIVLDPRFLGDRLSGGGNALLLLNAEVRFGLPFFSRFGFDGVAFFDSGNVWGNWDSVRIEEFALTGDVEGGAAERAYRTSFGFGVHYRTVVGPLRLEYGKPLRRARYGENEKPDPIEVWHFSLGHAF